MTFRAIAVTQRDGSALANSNCRMAAISSGINYHSLGAIKAPSAATMRNHQSDMSGGTDAGDAAQAWDNGYNQTLRIRNGYAWSDALADLRSGRMVHLDVWASAGGSPCLSGTGNYGHTVAVAPESNGSNWLVSDPWCNPPKWQWVSESSLRAGAESWGSQVYSATAGEADYPPGDPDTRDARVLLIVARVVRRMMTEHHPGNPRAGGSAPDTGGGGAILYTTTQAQAAEDEDMSRYISASGYEIDSAKRLEVAAGTDWYYLDGERGGEFSKVSTVVALGNVDSRSDRRAVVISTGNPYDDEVSRPTIVYVPSGALVDAPERDEDEIIAQRDAEWMAHLTPD